MPLPNIASFEIPLRQLATSGPADGLLAHLVLAEQPLVMGMPSHTDEAVSAAKGPAVNLWWPSSAELPFDSLVERVTKELHGRGHLADARLSKLVLAIFCQVRRPVASAVTQLNETLARIANADVSQFYVMRIGTETIDFEVTIGDFRVGPLDAARLADRCRRAKSDFFDRYGTALIRRIGAERQYFKQPMLDLGALPAREITPFEYYVTDEYFARTSTLLFERFWSDFRDQQNMLVAAGAPFLDDRGLRGVPLSQSITVFLNLGSRRQGWVSPGIQAFQIDFAHADRAIEHVACVLQDQSGAPSPTSEVHPTIAAFARLMARAVRHKLSDANDEAFLHFIIAIDLLFGEDGRSTASIARRVGLLAASRLGLNLDESTELIAKLYDTRSRYVHAGKAVPDDAVSEAEVICREVFFCALRHAKTSQDTSPQLSVSWARQLDFIRSAIDAGKVVAPEEWHAAGIDKRPGYR